jgi:superfamily II DNA/RNA helicase
MNEVFDLFQQTLASETPDYYALCHALRHAQQTLTGIEWVCSQSLLRLGLVLQQWAEGGAGHADLAVLMRQVIRSYKRRLIVPSALWDTINSKDVTAGLYVTQTSAGNLVELNARDWHPDWLTGTEQLDSVERRHYDAPVTGDGLLAAMSDGKFTHYQSQAQKVAVQACFFAPPGSTLLVALPTGAGKSLTMQLPAWYESGGGTIKGGTTIVVVPTVSLALDQEQRARQLFRSAPSPEYEPHSWIGSTPAETRAIIRDGLRYGTLPLLYVSPEALINTELYTICLDAASHGTLHRFVIDEVHLLETWGAGFRTEFQLLSAYRKQLLERSQGQLRTLLLSATISRSCERLLERLFGQDGHYYSVRANRLRAEPAYWFRFSQTRYTREQRVLEAIAYLPRPLILYVLSPDDAHHWYHSLKQRGFKRCATFTGDTDGTSRQQLIHAWNNDEIDIMIATSAFGVGIDKRHVRTILHACLPENIDRFYQEVGRAGRDGYSAISLVCTTVHDAEAAFNMTRAARITAEQAARRWEGMRKTAFFPHKDASDVLLVDTNAPPEGQPDMRRSHANKEWNEHTLLLMQRARLIEIMDTREHLAEIDHASLPEEAVDWLQIRLLDPPTTAYPESPAFLTRVEEVRNKEIGEIRQALRSMEKLVEEYGTVNRGEIATTHAKTCLAYHFKPLYPGCTLACGGCPYCREHAVHPYERPLPLDVDIEPGPPSASLLNGELRALMGWQAVINVTWDGIRHTEQLASSIQAPLATFVQAGVQQVLLPKALLALPHWTDDLIREISKRKAGPHQILAIEEIKEHIPLYALPTIIVYPADDDEADTCYRILRQHIQEWNRQRVPLFHLVHCSLFLASEQGHFLDRIDGIREDLTRLHMRVNRWQEQIL